MNKKDYHIIQVRDGDDFTRIITEDLHAKEGIAVTTGKLKSEPDKPQVVQEYLFDKNKWILEDAEKWVKENGEVLDIMLDKSEGVKSMKPITKIFDCEIKDFNEKERTFTAIASTEAVDRDGDILRVSGWKLSNYKKNPVGLWSHNPFSPPIFKTIAISVEDNKLKFIPKFVPKEISPFADEVFQLYKNGFLKAFSVRFLPYKWETIQPKQDVKPGTRSMYGRDYKSQELLEISGCTVPSNPECISEKSYQDILVKNLMVEKYDELSNEDKLKLYIGEEREGCKHCGKHKCERAEYGCENDLDKTDDLGEIVDVDNEEMKPFPNEHSCRIKAPGQYKTCRRTTRTTNGKKYSIITCQRKDDATKWEEQSYRYDIKSWTEAEARKHCTEHDGIKFEPAEKKDVDIDGTIGTTIKREGLINISVQDIDKVKPLLDILKSGRVISEKNKKLILNAIAELDKTSAALKGLLSISEPERSIDDIISEVKTDIGNEEVSKEDMSRLIKVIEENQTVLNSLKGQEG